MLAQFLDRFPTEWRDRLQEIEEASARLAQVRAHAFYGDEEQLIPASELFGEEDAHRALAVVDRLLGMYERLLGEDRAGKTGA